VKKITIALALVGAGLVACATNPATGKRILNILSENEEVAIGKQSDAQIREEMGVYGDQDWQTYVNTVGQTMAKASHRANLPWTFTVVDASAINAFALPGGYIYVTRGILPFLRNEAELANILGHEIAHVTAQHGAQAYSKQVFAGVGLGVGQILLPPDKRVFAEAAGLGLGLLFLKHGREQELEADRLGVGYAAATGWNPSGMAGMLRTLGRLSEASGSSRGVPNFLSTHPLPADRVEAIGAIADAARTSSSTRVDADEFARRLDGLVFGDSREQGIIRGRDFLHPILRIALRFPENWNISNGATAVTAQAEGNNEAAMVLEVAQAEGRSAAQVGRAQMAEAGFVERSADTTSINGLPAYVGVFDGGDDTQQYTVRAAFIEAVGRVYLLAGIATPTAFAGADATFRSAIGSFRALSQSEADGIQPARIDFHTVRAGDTWESLARTLADGAVSASALAIMNGADPGSAPAAGTRVRVVVGG
jgi:predicted Zn-dependent protease